ncbi:MAG: seg [Candidatus Adlerbacteria bacterium]|nr:seg [Candidatus Adlerbacteria bacterium]
MIDPLAKLFGSAARVKLLRLFLFNPSQSFTAAEAAGRSRVSSAEARRELLGLRQAGLLRKPRTKVVRYTLNEKFQYLQALKHLVLNTAQRGESVPERLRTAGSIKLIVLTGVFVGDIEASLDMLIAGDRMKEGALRERVRSLEAELGRELRYVFFPTADFLYRLNMSDKVVRDVMDYPHRIVYDRLDIGLK